MPKNDMPAQQASVDKIFGLVTERRRVDQRLLYSEEIAELLQMRNLSLVITNNYSYVNVDPLDPVPFIAWRRQLRSYVVPSYKAYQIAQEISVILPLENVRCDLNECFGEHSMPDRTVRDFLRHLAQGLPYITSEPFS